MAQAIGCDYANKIRNSHTPSTVLNVTSVTNVTALQGCNGCNGCNVKGKMKEEREIATSGCALLAMTVSSVGAISGRPFCRGCLPIWRAGHDPPLQKEIPFCRGGFFVIYDTPSTTSWSP